MRKPLGKIRNLSLARKVKRKLSARKRIIGTADKPRVCFNKTNKNLVAQVVDDSVSRVLFSVQTYGKNGVGGGSNKASAEKLGLRLAERLNEANVKNVVFDRSGHRYTGVVEVFANTVREKGIVF